MSDRKKKYFLIKQQQCLLSQEEKTGKKAGGKYLMSKKQTRGNTCSKEYLTAFFLIFLLPEIAKHLIFP